MINLVNKINRGLIIDLLTKRTWLLPFIYYIHSYQGLTLDELRELTGVRTQVIKRALWWLRKYGVIEQCGEKYIITEDARPIIDEFLLDYCTTGKHHILKTGSTYFVAIIRRTRITAYTIPAQYIEELKKMEENVQTEFTAEDLANTLGIPRNLAHRITYLRKILKECSKKA